MKTRIVTLTLFMSLAAGGAWAQVPKLWHVGVSGGTSLPLNDAKDVLKNGYNLQGFVTFALPGAPVGFRAALNYESFDFKQALGAAGTGSLLSGVANASYRFPLGVVTPYVTAGLGAYNTKSEITSGPITGSASNVNFGINGGAGVEFHFGMVRAFAEGKLENIYTDQGWSAAVGGAQNLTTQIVPVTFGVVF